MLGHGGRRVMQRSAKPRIRVRLPAVPPNLREHVGQIADPLVALGFPDQVSHRYWRRAGDPVPAV